MSDVTNTERCKIANCCRTLGNKGFDFTWDNVAHAIDAKTHSDELCWYRLADLIEPDNLPNLTDIYTWAYNCIEGADEPESSLYIGICDIIGTYFKEHTDKE